MPRKKLDLPTGVVEIYDNNCTTLIRNCPKCSGDILYTGKSARWNIKLAIKRHTVCNNCHTGKFRSDKTSWNKGIPMADTAKQKNRDFKKGKPLHTLEYKKWLSENSIFCIRGERNIRVQTMLRNMNMTYDQFLEYKSEFKMYHKAVWHITKQQSLTDLDNYSKRGLAGKEGAYHLDHIISIKEGYINNIPASDIANISNLHMIPWLINLKKGSKTNFKIEDIKNESSK
jgi:hypothetical protein